ncbi:MAG: TetR/AcrR family transcriptional regulator [Chloroflexi bacterium]|nr:MAG: TetR/AcrR family transcriptional regulator [Chloroflexota bacterium]MBL1195806.1 TetR/AcrR family transcriptional regulator [Chloroflexota bacterium]NOH13097.1 TetR/AcrR family transcriptional regulator [Chloroflexota bacterium]
MTKQQILEAAADIIGEKGFHGTSMNEIAQAVNLQKASLYHHVNSKQEILVNLLDQALDLLIENMLAVTEQDLTPEDKLRQAMRMYLEILADNRALASVLLLEHRSLEAKMRRRHIPRRDRFETLWRNIIEEGVEQGRFACEDPGLAVKALLGQLNWTIMWYRPNGKLNPNQIADQNADMFLNGLIEC